MSIKKLLVELGNPLVLCISKKKLNVSYYPSKHPLSCQASLPFRGSQTEVDSNYIQLLDTSSSFGYTRTFIMDEQNKAQVYES